MIKKISVLVLAVFVITTNLSAKERKIASASRGTTVAIGKVRADNINMNQNTAQNISDLAVDSCVKAGLRCLEREDIGAIRGEQDLANSNEAAPGQGRAKKGKFTTADILVTCALTGSTQDAAGVGVAVNNRILNTFGVKGVGVSADRVTMTCRAYDSSTSEILLSQTNNKMATTGELVIFNAKSSLAKTVEKAMDKFFKDLKEKVS